MRTPFPGMDPYLENPALWPDVHNSLVIAIRDALAVQLAPRYYVGVEQRMYVVTPDEEAYIGRADVGVVLQNPPGRVSPLPLAETGVIEVEVPVGDEVREVYLEIREMPERKLVTTVECLSPTNKHGKGRERYLEKRAEVLESRTNLVEIDLLRSGERMPLQGRGNRVMSDYRILVCRGSQRPRALLYSFSVRQPIPAFTLPLLPGDAEPTVDLNQILHDVYERAHYALVLRYNQPAQPPLPEAEAEWATGLINAAR